jgi:hypothetical protein
MSDITFPSTHVRDCDTDWDLQAKILQVLNAGLGGDPASDIAAVAFYASQAVAVASAENFYAASAASQAALLAELAQKTEPADAQLVHTSKSAITAEFTRPADTTAYAINDVVGPHTTPAVMTFTNVARLNGGSGFITNIKLTKSQTNSTNALFRLWIFNTAPAAIADNAQFTGLYADRAKVVGYVDLVCATEGTGSDCATATAANINLGFVCTGASRTLYGVLEAKQAYAPAANSEAFSVEITSVLD